MAEGVMAAAESKLKVLFICHNHPSLYPGGAEGYALEIYDEMKNSGEVDPIFLARVGNTASSGFVSHPGTPFSVLEADTHQYSMQSEIDDFEWLTLSQRQKELFTVHLREFLLTHRPDVVHVQHTLYLGVDMLREIRNTLPEVPIVYTLHDYRPICHRDGVLVRTKGNETCTHASPRRCNECFPDRSQEDFFMRQRFIQAHLSVVDLFLAPSEFLMERYIQWGIEPERIKLSDYGRAPIDAAEAEPREVRNRLGYFGQLNPYKGVTTLLQAMQLLGNESSNGSSNGSPVESNGKADPDPELRLHGANLEWQSEEFQREFLELVEDTESNVTYVGKYEKDLLPSLMGDIDWVIVPSIWWENSPLVIQEAFLYGKPVICSGIGGMAEKVTDGVNGLHFRAGDSRSLAQTIRKAVDSQGLWDDLRKGMPHIKTVKEDVRSLIDTYHELINTRTVD
jgi:glycosyltransferase involved in cell wall biosynthesis